MMQFPNPAANNSTTEDFLSALLYGGKCLGYKSLSFDETVAVLLSAVAGGIPAGALYAIIAIEADATEAGNARVARFRTDNTAPTAAEGMPVGDNGTFEVKGENLATLSIIGITAAKTHSLKVEFYGQG
jgi:hypothetical protein